MPAMLDDPTSLIIYRAGSSSHQALPEDVQPRTVTLRDRVTTATLIPFSSPDQVPHSLIQYLCDQLNKEIELGDTYPMTTPLPVAQFGPYWFANFGAVMLLGEIESAEQVQEIARNGAEWEKYCLGTFYIKPNYPGRSSHVCNGGFVVTPVARNKGVGRLMGEAYIEWAPKLGYTYSVFNLVYETNVVSCRIWDALGFKRIGRVKGCGNLRSHPDEYVDAIIFGRDLGQDEDTVSEERFDKIKFYLKHGQYPNGADRAEKSRLRSAATHYKLVPAIDDIPERLMLKDKEVISDPQKQYEIARNIHIRNHGGINKSTAAIAEKYHWVRIKETVSAVIKNCGECSEASKAMPRLESSRRVSSHGPTVHAVDALTQALPQHDSYSAPQVIYRTPYTNTVDQEHDLAAVRQYNSLNASNALVDPRLPLGQLGDFQQQTAQPRIATAPAPSMMPHLRGGVQPSNTSPRPVATATEPHPDRSSSPSAQLLQEQERTPASLNYPPFPRGEQDQIRQSPVLKTDNSPHPSPTTIRESKRRRTKK